jgi:hypothetical protein
VEVSVIRNGREIKRQEYRKANLETGARVAANTVFQSGSMAGLSPSAKAAPASLTRGLAETQVLLVRVPEKRLSVVVLANLDVADTATIGKQILELYEPKLRDGLKRADSRIP